MKHKVAVNVLMLFWLFGISRLVWASTFTQEVMTFDYQSVATAVVAGFFGGLVKTIFTLQSDDRAVFFIFKEARRDAVRSCIAGGAAYLLMILIESIRPGTITQEMRFVGVLAAGWTRDFIFVIIGRLFRAKLDAKVAELRGGAPEVSTTPTSASVPLEK